MTRVVSRPRDAARVADALTAANTTATGAVAWPWLALFVAARIALPLLTLDDTWQFHRDELLYFAMGDHFSPFAMQFPPFIAAVAAVSKAIFGDAVWAARVPAALAGGAILAVLLWLVRRLGGGLFAALLVALASVAAPVLLRLSVLFQPVGFDQLWSILAVGAVILALHEDEPRWWLLAGLGFGLGALTKFSAAFYVAALAPAVLLVPAARAHLATRWPWVGALGALLLAIPSLSGQIVHDWPFLAQMNVLRGAQLERVTNGAFLGEQPLLLGAAALPVVIALLAVVRPPRAVDATRLAALYAFALLTLMLVLDGKAYYAAPAYLPLLATGALAFEAWTARLRRRPRLAARVAMPALLLGGSVAVYPLGVPSRPPDETAAFAAHVGVTAAVETNRGEVLALPQDFADMLGWREDAALVAGAWRALAPAEQARTLVIGGNYGQAGALAMYAKRFGYPYPSSTAGDFHAWGITDPDATTLILLGGPGSRADLEQFYADVREVAVRRNPQLVPEERDVRVYVARGPRQSLGAVWPTLGPNW